MIKALMSVKTLTNLIKFTLALILMVLSSSKVVASDMATEENTTKPNNSSENVTVVDEVSIIGTSELPNVTFNLPWRLPSVQKRGDTSPPKTIPGMLDSIEPYRHKQRVYFSRHLEVDIPQFREK